jgi:hypothetical protein
MGGGVNGRAWIVIRIVIRIVKRPVTRLAFSGKRFTSVGSSSPRAMESTNIFIHSSSSKTTSVLSARGASRSSAAATRHHCSSISPR